MPFISYIELLKIVFTKCLRDNGTQVTYDFEFIDNEPQQPERESPAPLGPDNAPSWLQVVRATATGDEQQDEPHGHPLTLMVSGKSRVHNILSYRQGKCAVFHLMASLKGFHYYGYKTSLNRQSHSHRIQIHVLVVILCQNIP